MIEFTIKAKPAPKRYRIVNLPVEDPQNGGHAARCKCGRHFAAFFGGDEDVYRAFLNLVNERAAYEMQESGQVPFCGPVELAVTIYKQRPQNHYIGGDRGRAVKEQFLHATPSNVDTLGVIEAIRRGLEGAAIFSYKQAQRPIGTPLFDDRDSVRIRVRPYLAKDADARNKQLELF